MSQSDWSWKLDKKTANTFGNFCVGRNLAQDLKLVLCERLVQRGEVLACDSQKLLLFAGGTIVPDQFDFVCGSPACQLHQSANFRFIKTSFHITAVQLVSRVELKDEILPEVETCGAIAAEAGDDGFGEAFDLQFHALHQGSCFAEQVFPWFFFARHGHVPLRKATKRGVISRRPHRHSTATPIDQTAATANLLANRPKHKPSRVPLPTGCRLGNDTRRQFAVRPRG